MRALLLLAITGALASGCLRSKFDLCLESPPDPQCGYLDAGFDGAEADAGSDAAGTDAGSDAAGTDAGSDAAQTDAGAADATTD